MHETDAMNFIEPVLLGFLGRQFNYLEGEDPKLYEPHLKKIREFIRDNEPHWVKEKALYIIAKIEQAENDIQTGRYTPSSTEAFVNALIKAAREMLDNIANYYRIEQVAGKMNVPMNMPSLPKKK